MTKLTDRQIVQMHDMHREGISNKEIARALGLNRNSVSAHLAGDVTYTTAVYQKIRLAAPLNPSEWLSMRQAAPWIPGHPSRARMQMIITGKSWGGSPTPKLRTKIGQSGKRFTRTEWIAEFLAKIYPPGIWISNETLFNSVPLPVIHRMPLVRLGWIKGTERQFGGQVWACKLCVATRVLDQHELTFDCSPLVIHRATTVHEYVGIAVI